MFGKSILRQVGAWPWGGLESWLGGEDLDALPGTLRALMLALISVTTRTVLSIKVINLDVSLGEFLSLNMKNINSNC